MKVKYIVKGNKIGNIAIATKSSREFRCDFLNPEIVKTVNTNIRSHTAQRVLFFFKYGCKNLKRNVQKSDQQRIDDIQARLDQIAIEAVNEGIIATIGDVLVPGWSVLSLPNEIEVEVETPTIEEPVKVNPMESIKKVLGRLIDFFSEFDFEPNFRFVNTLCLSQSPVDYVTNYFTLSDNNFLASIKEKMKSYEFKSIIEDMKEITPTTVINKHLKIYYGSQGTGKTTMAMGEANDNCMVCHSAMLPSDLLEDFDFEQGNATFKPSALYRAIEEGKKIVLDELNLLPFESVRFLQSILDGKKCFEYKGRTVNIHDDFQIIGTMNLTVNGGTYALPEPLIDRAADLKQFKLTADMLASALV